MKNTTRFAALSLILAAGLLAGCCNDGSCTDSAEAGKATTKAEGCCGGEASAKAKSDSCCEGEAQAKSAGGCCGDKAK